MFKQKIIAALTVAGLTLSSAICTAANPFSDMPEGHWAARAVTKLAGENIINGYGNGLFRGDRNITRYEAVNILAKCLNLELNVNAPEKMPFSDVPENHWAFRAVKLTSEKGINKGYDDKTFRGDRYITRYEMAQMIANVLKPGLQLPEKSFSDIPANHWAVPAVTLLASKGIIEGYNDGLFRLSTLHS